MWWWPAGIDPRLVHSDVFAFTSPKELNLGLLSKKGPAGRLLVVPPFDMAEIAHMQVGWRLCSVDGFGIAASKRTELCCFW